MFSSTKLDLHNPHLSRVCLCIEYIIRYKASADSECHCPKEITRFVMVTFVAINEFDNEFFVAMPRGPVGIMIRLMPCYGCHFIPIWRSDWCQTNIDGPFLVC